MSPYFGSHKNPEPEKSLPVLAKKTKKRAPHMERRFTKAQRAALKVAFVEALGSHLTLENTARAVGVSRRQILDWRKEDPEFQAAIDRARESALDKLEDKAYEVALNESGKYFEKDSLLNRFFLLKGYRPQFKDAWRPEDDAPPMVITFNLPEREGIKRPALPEHFVEGEIVSQDG